MRRTAAYSQKQNFGDLPRFTAFRPDCVKTFDDIEFEAAASSRDSAEPIFRILEFFAAGVALWAGFWVPCSGAPGDRRKMTPTSPYAAFIAAISGPMPRMFMTRLRL